jgi:DNA-binding transcriptional LysR family regulator
MDFQQLKTFLEVWRQKSFSRAAEKLGITQPAVSAQIRSLEKEIGERLFDRTGGKVTFTAAGRVFEPFAEHALGTQRHMLLMVAEQRHSARGEIAISAQESTSLYVLPEVFAEFKKHYPKVGLKITRSERSRTLEALLNREVDFGVVSLPVKDARFVVETLHHDEFVLCTPKGHPLAAMKNVEAADMVKHSFLMPKQGKQRELLLNIFRMNDIYPKKVMEVESGELMKRFVIAGLGVGFLPTVNIADERASGSIEVVQLDSIRLSRDLALIYLKDKPLTRAISGFIEIALNKQGADD